MEKLDQISDPEYLRESDLKALDKMKRLERNFSGRFIQKRIDDRTVVASLK